MDARDRLPIDHPAVAAAARKFAEVVTGAVDDVMSGAEPLADDSAEALGDALKRAQTRRMHGGSIFDLLDVSATVAGAEGYHEGETMEPTYATEGEPANGAGVTGPDVERLERLQSTAAPSFAAADKPALGSRELALKSGPGRRPTRDIYVPIWNAVYRVQGLSGEERDYYEQLITVQTANGERIDVRDARAKLIQLTVIDDRGHLMFGTDDIKQLSKQPAAALEPLFDAARALSGMTKTDFEELTANFPSGRTGGSISG